MFSTLEVSSEGAVGRLWLNRPERLNALSTAVLRELAEAARWFDGQEEVRVVVVGGRGRAFSAGADLDGFPAMGDTGVRDAADAGRIMADALEGMRAVAVARIQGWCVGGGLVLAAACDLRVAADTARFSIPEVDLGIPLAWGGIPRLVREIGPALTRELVITCREFDAAEARDCGFLNRVVAEDALDAEVETLPFVDIYDAAASGHQHYDLSRDGTKFLMVRHGRRFHPKTVHVIEHWPGQIDGDAP